VGTTTSVVPPPSRVSSHAGNWATTLFPEPVGNITSRVEPASAKKAGLRGDLLGLRLIVLEAARAQRVEQAIPEGGPVVAASVQEVDLRSVLKPVGVPVGGHQFKLAGPVCILGPQVVERAPRAQTLPERGREGQALSIAA
jgi:hypothetical protein